MNTTKQEMAVIGAGTMGLGITQLFAQNGFIVKLIDPNQQVIQNAKEKIEDELSLLREYKFITSTEMESLLKNIIVSTSLEAASESMLVVEAVPENLEIKQELFKKMETICSEATIFATNTSGLSISQIASILKHPARFVGTHFFMPASIIPLVEIVKGEKTDDQIANKVLQLFQDIGKEPVLIKKDIPGFIANRIQHAMAREAISLLEEQVATAKEIDTVVRWSLGVRLLFTGPLEQRDLNGLDVHSAIASYLYKDLENRTEPSTLLTEKVEKGELGIKTGNGFYEWDKNRKNQVLQHKNNSLLKLMKTLKNIDSAN